MLLAVEGGRFFSSSASGYSNGLSLLLLSQRKDDKPMRVTPWNQYHLVDQELAANKNPCVCGCASFVCFGGAVAGPDSPSVGSKQDQQNDVHKTTLDLGKVDDTRRVDVTSLKSSLKRPSTTVPISVAVAVNDDAEVEGVCQNGRRSVNWTDVTGGELFEVREFEPSEYSDSDDEFENSNGKTCSCTIM